MEISLAAFDICWTLSMPPRGLTINNTPIEVAICDWHLRKIFNDEDFAGQLQTNQMTKLPGFIRERTNPSRNAPSLADAPYVEEFFIIDPATNEEVARCQQFLKADKRTVAASGKPDPKEINWGGYNYHQLGKKYPECEHCKAGIPSR